MAGPTSLLCALSPLVGTLLTPSAGGLKSASLVRPLAFSCDLLRHGERWDPFASAAVGYNLEFKLADVRLIQAGARWRFQANPAWGKDSDEQTVMRPAVGRGLDPFASVAMAYLNHTAYFLGDDERLTQANVQSFGASLGLGADWYFYGDVKERDAGWSGILATGEMRLAVLPLALGNPAFQSVIFQTLLGVRYIF